ncbi:hypothetical protein IW262DRAFT_1296907 [Armillaria fumosa]|nr:hypothetical protein IW262DRAFT_1296907 [Armillaria fumosa]
MGSSHSTAPDFSFDSIPHGSTFVLAFTPSVLINNGNITKRVFFDWPGNNDDCASGARFDMLWSVTALFLVAIILRQWHLARRARKAIEKMNRLVDDDLESQKIAGTGGFGVKICTISAPPSIGSRPEQSHHKVYGNQALKMTGYKNTKDSGLIFPTVLLQLEKASEPARVELTLTLQLRLIGKSFLREVKQCPIRRTDRVLYRKRTILEYNPPMWSSSTVVACASFGLLLLVVFLIARMCCRRREKRTAEVTSDHLERGRITL